MKKILSKILVFALVVCLSGAVSVFAGCQVGNGGGSTSDYEHTITFYSSQGDDLEALTAIAISAFEAKFPGWKVNHVADGGYDDVRNTVIGDLKTGSQPDLAYCYPDHVALYIQTKKVVDMNKYINSTETVNGYTVGYSKEELADFVKTYWEEGLAEKFGGYSTYGYQKDSMLTLPFLRSTEVMYYNKTALDALGLTPANTWEELWAQCGDLMKNYPNCTPLGYDSEANWFITMCEQNGWGYTSANADNHYLFNGDEQAAWLTELAGYYKKGYVTTKMDLNNAYTSSLFTKGVDEGGLVYCIGSSGGASHQDPSDKFEYGIASIPGSTVNGVVNKSVISQGPSLVMLTGGNGVSNASEKEKMTFLFIKELLDVKQQASYAISSGYNAVRISASEVDKYKEAIATGTITSKVIALGETLRDYFFVSDAFDGSSNARDQAGTLLYNAMLGADAKDTLDEAYRNCGGK